MPRSPNATQRRMNQIHEDDVRVALENPTNMDLQKQINQVRQDNHDEHTEMKNLITRINDKLDASLAQRVKHEQQITNLEQGAEEEKKARENIQLQATGGLVLAVVTLTGIIFSVIWSHVTGGK